MLLKLLLLLNISLLAVICSQAIFYVLAMTSVQKDLSAASYVELRQVIDRKISGRLKYVYYAALITGAILLPMTYSFDTGLLFFAVLFSMICLVLDIAISLLGNVPINQVIREWHPENIPYDWQSTRNQWLRLYAYRQVLAIAGVLVLLAAMLFES